MREPISVRGATYDEMWAAAAAAGDPLAGIEQIEELFRYDGCIIDIVKDQTGQIWLRNVVDEDDAGGDGLRHIVVTTHFLAFDSIEALKATMHNVEIPTREGYENAVEIVEQVISYDTIVSGRSSNHEYASRKVWREKIVEDHLPYVQLKPGRRMVFEPLADFMTMTREESDGLYRYPVPEDEVVVFHDCVRSWIGRFPDESFEPRIHMVACMKDDGPVWVQHRLSFAPADEAAFRTTLAAGQAPTMDTYRLAKEIHRETIDSTDVNAAILTVDRIDADSLGDESPTYRDVAQHDEEWPAFAADRKD
jgi:hypothetical protein